MHQPGKGTTGNSNRHIGLYELLQTLGSGGFSKVYLGKHMFLGTEAAVKVLRASMVHEQTEQFEIEARIIAGLRHPHIVRILDFDVENNIPFLVMEFASHGSLRQRHPVSVPVPLATVVSYAKQVSGALQYAHDRGVIHRDVKPENMLLGERDEVLLTDFGIAIGIQENDTQVIYNIAGTLPYMAPEQIDGWPCGASDQYALAVVVYEWLTATHPFTGNESEIIRQHFMAIPPSLCERAPTVPPAVERVVMRALSKDPEQRYSSVSKFAAALEKASRQAPQASGARQGTNATQRSIKRFSPLAASLLVIAFLVTFGSIWGIVTSLARQVTVTITPVTRYVTNDFGLIAAPGKADSSRHLVSAHRLSSMTPSESKTVDATGMGETPGVQASGVLTFYNGLVTPQVVDAGTIIKNAQGIQVVTNVPAYIPPANPPYLGSVSVPAYALKAGTSGNIGAGSINQPCCASDDSITVRNLLAFSVGQDPQPYIFVKQSDITGAADSLERELRPTAEGLLHKQVLPNEMLVPPVQCIWNVDSDHAVNERVKRVKVTVAVTCGEWVFNSDAARLITSTLLMEEALKRFGTNYALTGNVSTIFQQVALKNAKQGMIFLLIRAGGLWVYQFSNAQKRFLARLIAGKSQDDARTQLLIQIGVSQVDFQIPWWVLWIIKDRLPDNVDHIMIDIVTIRPAVPSG
jgi:serine/threonine protein kinase